MKSAGRKVFDIGGVVATTSGGTVARLTMASAVAVLVLSGSVRPVLAETDAALDDVTAAGLCTGAYPGTNGPDALSPCQWDMSVVNAGAANQVTVTVCWQGPKDARPRFHRVIGYVN